MFAHLTLVAILAVSVPSLAAPANLTKRATGKAGISWPVQELTAAPVTKFFGSDSHLSWWFDWNKNYGHSHFPNDATPPTINAEFIPTLFDSKFATDSDPLQAGWSEITGYNEPDLNGLDATTAAADWKADVDTIRGIKSDAKIQSPGPAIFDDNTWLDTWFQGICPAESAPYTNCKYKPDFLTVHIYVTDVAKFQSILTGLHTKYGIPLVVREFACYSFGGGAAASQQQVHDFMGATTKWLDQTDFIAKYAWFGAVRDEANLIQVAPTNRLMDASGELTDLGKQYVGGGHK